MKNALVGILTLVTTLSVMANVALMLAIRTQDVRIEGLVSRVGTLESQNGYQKTALDAHAEVLIDWYKVRRFRSEHWGSAIYWAEKAALDVGGGE